MLLNAALFINIQAIRAPWHGPIQPIIRAAKLCIMTAKMLLKTLTFGDYQQYLDKYWRAHELFMQNHVTKKTTLLRWEGFAFRTGLSAKDFTQNSLKRAR